MTNQFNGNDPLAKEETETQLEDLWQFAGQGLRSSDFNTAMVHFYRGEVTRSNTWRNRLDATTNWAVITTGAALTFTFGDIDHTPLVIIVDTLLVLLFLLIEARRYRYYELWTYRVRLMETNFYGGLLSPPFLPKKDWADKISESLKNPAFPISLGEAFGRRYRRNYAPIFFILAFGWVLKVAVHPTPAANIFDIVQRAEVGFVSGWFIVVSGIVFHAILFSIGLFTTRLQDSPGEVFGKTELTWTRRIGRLFRLATWEALEIDVPHFNFRLFKESRQQLIYIISDKDEAISTAVLQKLGRGITRFEGTGMYTGENHHVLLCVYEQSQTKMIKQLIKEIDPNAFVVITDVKDVHGNGFRPLEA
jgi:uncharacterized membrane protein